MVVPPLFHRRQGRSVTHIRESKAAIRQQLRQARIEHATGLPGAVSALVFRRPPAPVLAMLPDDAVIGLYRAAEGEAPAAGYARYFAEAGYRIALPRIEGPGAPMHFHAHTDPFGESDLFEGPMKLMQPPEDAAKLVPNVVFVPLVGFTERGERLGQGGGFYDRWLAEHPEAVAIGLAWDVQLVDELPLEPHDRSLTAIVTPTRIYGPFA